MSNPLETPWPVHPNGRPKKMREMTPAERKAQFKDAAQQVKVTMETPAMREAIQEYVDGTTDAQPKH
jgi:hypothetical protein